MEGLVSGHVFQHLWWRGDYNATLEQKGWDIPGFNDHSWKVQFCSGWPGVVKLTNELLLKFQYIYWLETAVSAQTPEFGPTVKGQMHLEAH